MSIRGGLWLFWVVLSIGWDGYVVRNSTWSGSWKANDYTSAVIMLIGFPLILLALGSAVVWVFSRAIKS